MWVKRNLRLDAGNMGLFDNSARPRFAPELCTEILEGIQGLSAGANVLEAARNQGEGLFAAFAAGRYLWSGVQKSAT